MKRFFGLFLVAIGVVVILSNLNLLLVKNLVDYLWPTALILLGLISIFNRRRFTIWGLILIAIGGLYLALAFGVFHVDNASHLILPIVLVAIGLGLLFGRHHGDFSVHLPKDPIHINVGNEYKSSYSGSANTSSRQNYTGFLSGINEHVLDDAFTTCEVTALLGGCEMDFRDVKFAGNEATLVLNAIFGGVECYLPKDIRIVASGTPMLGGFENHCVSDPSSSKTLYIRYTAMFGAVEIKN
jgi:predicted membrane protein